MHNYCFVGMHVKIRDERWAYAVDRAIKGVMCDYIVDNAHDDKVSQALNDLEFCSYFGRGDWLNGGLKCS